jgi:hypothetical protein
MKPFVAMLLLLAVAMALLAAQSFQSRFGQATYSPPPPVPEAPVVDGGGSARKAGSTADSSASSSNDFRGPTGKPHIIGPSAPPPGQ